MVRKIIMAIILLKFQKHLQNNHTAKNKNNACKNINITANVIISK